MMTAVLIVFALVLLVGIVGTVAMMLSGSTLSRVNASNSLTALLELFFAAVDAIFKQ